MGDARLSAADMKALQEETVADQKKQVSAQFRSLYVEAQGIPLRAKTQYPTYIEGRTLHLLRGISEVERVSVQGLIREGIELAINKRLRLIPIEKRLKGGTKKPRRKKAASKKRS